MLRSPHRDDHMTTTGVSSARPERARTAHWRKRLIVISGLFVAGVVLYTGFVLTLPAPNLWVGFRATSESLSFRVINPEMAAFRISGMRGTSVDGRFSACVDAMITPKAGARMSYRRGDEKYYQITIDAPESGAETLTIRDRGKPASVLRGNVIFAAAEECSGSVPKRLPVWGPAEFGEEVRPANVFGIIVPGSLIEGTIEVFAHAQDRLLGLSFPSVVYSVTTFNVPPGSVLTTPDGVSDETTWTGFVRLPQEGFGVEVQASSNTRAVTIRSTRAFSDSASSSRRIDLGQFAQVLNDPNIIQLQFFVGALMLLIQALASVGTFFLEAQGPDLGEG
jgi:hypothetical protein